MDLQTGQYFHLYNRSNAGETVFREPENYAYFLERYRGLLSQHFGTVAYCLMPTHFHFLIRVDSLVPRAVQDAVGVWLSGYTKAINKRLGRHGSLFQMHSRAKHVESERYLLALISYIHQNPKRANLVSRLEDWPYSSYLDLAGYRRGTLPERGLIGAYFPTDEAFRDYSNVKVEAVDRRHWVT